MVSSPKNKILLVDDDPVILTTLEQILSRDYIIVSAADARQGLDILESDGPFSVIISDKNMPEMDGIEFLRESKIVSEDAIRLMLTGCSEQETVMHAINDCGVFKFITKPFKPANVLKNVQAAVDEYNRRSYQREKAESSSKSRERFLMNVNHELRTPLNPIIGLSDLLLGSDLTEEDRFFVETIALSGRNLLMKVNTILKYAESNHKGLGARPSNFRPRLLFDELSKQFAKKVENKQLEMNLCVQENVPKFIRADREKINMIMIQLLSNAVKFSESGRIYANLDARKMFKDQWNLYIVVKDQGVGISSEDLRHIYTPFEKINEDIIGKFDGLGLGLTLVYKLVNALRGNIKVHSELGKGSTFVVEVPGAVVSQDSERSVNSVGSAVR